MSGHEIYCLHQNGYAPGNIVIVHSVHALGFLGSLGSGVKAMLGGEIRAITEFIAEGRETAYTRMRLDAEAHNAHGISGVNTQLISHGSNIEFLSVGSALHALKNPPEKLFLRQRLDRR